ncbi:MAG: hypothetical protein JWM95_4254 [Gemmatimonadetes bacterium]|nr:hypothetical protein [Gemmatimonadota bacterium]
MTGVPIDLIAVIRAIANRLPGDQSLNYRSAAKATNGLPVYEDMGGVLVLCENGDVLRYDPETRRVEIVAEAKWRRVAYAFAARTYLELQSLRQRPVGAVECPVCSGSGYVLGDAVCGNCFGMGWIQSPASSE